MIDCPVNHPALPGLFDPHTPNNPALWAVLLGRHRGKALVDDSQNPRECLVHTEASLTYASREMSQEFLKQAIAHFRLSDRIWLIHKPGDVPAPEGYKIVPRLEFYDCDPQSQVLEDLRSELPAGYSIHPIDWQLLQRCEWRDDMAFYSGSLENFLRQDLGICLMHGEDILCEAYANPVGSPYAEVGAITREPFRGRGLAPITMAYLIELLYHRGYRAYWSCDQDNLASARVARKLGFKVEQPYEIFEYSPFVNSV
jgi:RimJ/RimL family protein N-acetyltransferase